MLDLYNSIHFPVTGCLYSLKSSNHSMEYFDVLILVLLCHTHDVN